MQPEWNLPYGRLLQQNCPGGGLLLRQEPTLDAPEALVTGDIEAPQFVA